MCRIISYHIVSCSMYYTATCLISSHLISSIHFLSLESPVTGVAMLVPLI